MTQEEKQAKFIEKAKLVHSEENLDYSEVFYVNNRTKVKIIDRDLDENGNEYGEWYPLPCNFLKGQGHPKKKGRKIHTSKKSTQSEIIKRFEEKHKNEGLDYSKVCYVNMHTKVCIIDPIYGEYWQEPVVHLKGCGHPKRNRKPQTLSQNEFLNKCKKIHGDKYDYSKTVYKNYREKITINCPLHGDFEQTAENHLYGKGCPKCGNHYSHFEDDIIKEFSTPLVQHNHQILDGKEIDIYFPDKKIGIEFNGLRWHTEWFAGKDRYYHLSKTNKCEEQGIRLIQIFEDEYDNNKELVINKIKHILGENSSFPKIYARKCKINKISKDEAKVFLTNNHIQGYGNSTICLGAYYNDKLVGVMSFKHEFEHCWELVRFATDINYNCCGVGGKLFSAFVNEYNPSEIKSFADRRWTSVLNDNLYTKIGFKKNSILPPDYRYYNPNIDRKIRFHKFGFRKKILINKYGEEYGLTMEMTETEMTKKLGYDRIWDCGLIKYVWKKEDC